MTYIIDGSFEGLLCAVFEWFERKPGPVTIKTGWSFQPDVFSGSLRICNDRKKADRVWKGLESRLSPAWLRKFYCTFLSELPGSLPDLFEFACYIFSSDAGAEQNYGNAHVLSISQTAVRVEREKHRMEAFIRFRGMADGLFYCGIDPDFNVLPLIINHFKNRYADQKWIIYDLGRHYGFYYDLEKTEEVQLSIAEEGTLKNPAAEKFSNEEELYGLLWKNYFKSTNIAVRKNTKLHVKHVPKRYWKYLTEKI